MAKLLDHSDMASVEAGLGAAEESPDQELRGWQCSCSYQDPGSLLVAVVAAHNRSVLALVDSQDMRWAAAGDLEAVHLEEGPGEGVAVVEAALVEAPGQARPDPGLP